MSREYFLQNVIHKLRQNIVILSNSLTSLSINSKNTTFCKKNPNQILKIITLVSMIIDKYFQNVLRIKFHISIQPTQ